MKREAGYYNHVTLDKFRSALSEAKQAVKAAKDPSVKISNANSKMGAVASVSTLPFITCPSCCAGTCGVKCYAAKLANLRPSVLKASAWNTALYMVNPAAYWNGIDQACKAVRYFRFHVSGDMTDGAYFANMIRIAQDNPKTEILVFTKRFQVVNSWIRDNGQLPANLHVMFSGWSNLKPSNPYNLPETNVIEKGSEPNPSWKLCGGNCFNCACRGVGCWATQAGDTIAFKIH